MGTQPGKRAGNSDWASSQVMARTVTSQPRCRSTSTEWVPKSRTRPRHKMVDALEGRLNRFSTSPSHTVADGSTQIHYGWHRRAERPRGNLDDTATEGSDSHRYSLQRLTA